MERAWPAARRLVEAIRATRVASPPFAAAGAGAATVSAEVDVAQALATHSGHFHCDESLALAMLKALPENEARVVVRTRDAPTLAKARVVVDVGATYEPPFRLDHHQRGFNTTLDERHSMKLSSAGLVFKHYGRDIIRALVAGTKHTPLDDATVEKLHEKLYSSFVEHIDGIDNGVEAAEGKKNYAVTTTLSARVGHLNPAWNEDSSPEAENERFKEAMEMCALEFCGALQRLVDAWLPARRIVEDAVRTAGEAHASGKVIKLARPCPWKDHLFDLEAETDKVGHFVYVLYPEGDPATAAPGTNMNWRVQCVPVQGDEFASRKKLPEKLCGLRDADLSKALGVDDAIFVHAGGFIGGAKSLSTATKLADVGLSS